MKEQENVMNIEKDSVAEVEKYIKENIIPAKEGRKCVDGRYSKDQASGMIARPGGDFGYVMALMRVNKDKNLGLSAKECFDKVFDVVTQDGGKFYMHTDHHADPLEEDGDNENRPSIGCGHVGKALLSENEMLFGINGEDLEELVGVARDIEKNSAKLKIVNLAGEHEETGTIVINSSDKTINPSNGDKMYFLYDKERDTKFMDDLVEKMDIPGLTQEDFMDASDRQLEATLLLLAKGFPLYSAYLENGNISVSSAGIIGE